MLSHIASAVICDDIWLATRDACAPTTWATPPLCLSAKSSFAKGDPAAEDNLTAEDDPAT